MYVGRLSSGCKARPRSGVAVRVWPASLRLSMLMPAATLFVAIAMVAAPSTAQANWLTKIVREAGEAGTKSGKLGLGALDEAAVHVKSLPAGGSGLAFAAHATPEGHWKFVNKSGDVFTAGTPEEMKRLVSALAPEATAGEGNKLALHLSEDTLFRERKLIKDLPKDARLAVVIDTNSYPLLRRTEGGVDKWYAEVRPNLTVIAQDAQPFREAIWQLSRPLTASNLRVLALEPGGPDSLAALPRFDSATKGALVDRVDPNSLPRALSGIRGQTAVLTARIEAGELRFVAGGSERALPMAEVERAADASGVRLVILQSSQPRQPGGRNWLWQTVAVEGLDTAVKRATVADFLNALGSGRDALGAPRGPFAVDVIRSGEGRTRMRAVSVGSESKPITGQLGDWAAEIASNLTGNVVTSAVELVGNSQERQAELDLRIIPGIPSGFQLTYLAGLVAGILGLGVARGWWARIWPPEDRKDYAGALGYHAARCAKFLGFVAIFLPLAGGPAFVKTLILQLWAALMLPVRALRWIIGLFWNRQKHVSG